MKRIKGAISIITSVSLALSGCAATPVNAPISAGKCAQKSAPELASVTFFMEKHRTLTSGEAPRMISADDKVVAILEPGDYIKLKFPEGSVNITSTALVGTVIGWKFFDQSIRLNLCGGESYLVGHKLSGVFYRFERYLTALDDSFFSSMRHVQPHLLSETTGNAKSRIASIKTGQQQFMSRIADALTPTEDAVISSIQVLGTLALIALGAYGLASSQGSAVVQPQPITIERRKIADQSLSDIIRSGARLEISDETSGVRYTVQDSTIRGSDGSRFRISGNFIYGENGSYMQIIGNQLFLPNGRTCSKIGEKIQC